MTQTERRAIGDMKQGLTGAKPKLSILPRAMLDHGARPIEYGADKYARGNYHGPPPTALGEHAAGLRVLGYIDAAIRHLTRVSNAMNRALGTGGDVRAACATVDDDATGGFPPSGLPDLSHALASVGLGITCAVDDGLLPADPGRPWDALRPPVELPQKADPAAERRRVDSLGRRATDADPNTPENAAIVEIARVCGDERPSGATIAESMPAREIAARVRFAYTQAEIDAAKAASLLLVPAGPRFVAMRVGDVPPGAVAEVFTEEQVDLWLRSWNGEPNPRCRRLKNDFADKCHDRYYTHAIVDTRPEETK